MWYHYLILVLVIVNVVNSIYDMVKNRRSYSVGMWIYSAIMLALSLAIAYWAINGIRAPVAPVVMGGRRR
jgi:hypothetical protein